MGIVMFDTVTVSQVPSFANTSADAVAGYDDGLFDNISQMTSAFPKAHHLSIAVHASDNGEVLDVENGDAVNSDAPGWVRRQQARKSSLIVLYTSASNVQALINTLASAGINRSHYKIWSAHYTFNQHICAPGVCGYPQADGTQWTDHALDRNLDESYLLDNFFGKPAPPPPPPDPHHYRWFTNKLVKVPTGKRINEKSIVMEYDQKRRHPTMNKLRLKTLKQDCLLLADEILVSAYENLTKDLQPNWGVYHRGWRHTQLIQRSEGKKLA